MRLDDDESRLGSAANHPGSRYVGDCLTKVSGVSLTAQSHKSVRRLPGGSKGGKPGAQSCLLARLGGRRHAGDVR